MKVKKILSSSNIIKMSPLEIRERYLIMLSNFSQSLKSFATNYDLNVNTLINYTSRVQEDIKNIPDDKILDTVKSVSKKLIKIEDGIKSKNNYLAKNWSLSEQQNSKYQYKKPLLDSNYIGGGPIMAMLSVFKKENLPKPVVEEHNMKDLSILESSIKDELKKIENAKEKAKGKGDISINFDIENLVKEESESMLTKTKDKHIKSHKDKHRSTEFSHTV